MAVNATAQVPFIQAFFDDDSNASYSETQAVCGPANTMQNLYLVLFNANAFVAAVDYQLLLPGSGALLFLSDSYPVVPGGSLNIGNSNDGNAISYGLPRSGFSPMLLVTVSTLWTNACNCGSGPQPIVVGPYPDKTSPGWVRWPDFVEFSAVGMTSLLCPEGVAVQESTWGGIKALYR
jgi:hypothetical protein